MNTFKLTFPFSFESNKGNHLFSASALCELLGGNDVLCPWGKKENSLLTLVLGGQGGRTASCILCSHTSNTDFRALAIHVRSCGAVCLSCVAGSEIGTVILLIVLLTHALHLM